MASALRSIPRASGAGLSNPERLKSNATGLEYILEGFSSDALECAKAGFDRKADIVCERARFFEDEPDYYAFQLRGSRQEVVGSDRQEHSQEVMDFEAETPPQEVTGSDEDLCRFRLLVKRPGGREITMPECECNRGRSGVICAHVFWLVNQIRACLSLDEATITPDGPQLGDISLYQHIEEIGIEELRQMMPGVPRPTTKEEVDCVERFLQSLAPDGATVDEPLKSLLHRRYMAFSELIVKYARRHPQICRLIGMVDAETAFGVLTYRLDKAFDNQTVEKAVAELQEICGCIEAEYNNWKAIESLGVGNKAVRALSDILQRIAEQGDDSPGKASGLVLDILKALLDKPQGTLSDHESDIKAMEKSIHHTFPSQEIIATLREVMNRVGGGEGQEETNSDTDSDSE